MKLKDIEFQNGLTYKDFDSLKDMDPETEVEYDKKVARQVGTGYKNYYYRIIGTDDAIIDKQGFGSNAFLQKDYYNTQKRYGRECATIAKEFNLPWDVCAAIGNDRSVYSEFIETLNHVNKISCQEPSDLYSGINRRKFALREVLGDNLYDKLGIESMGQKNSQSIADYVRNRIDENEKQLLQYVKQQTELLQQIETQLNVSEDVAANILIESSGLRQHESLVTLDELVKQLESIEKTVEYLMKETANIASYEYDAICCGDVKSNNAYREIAYDMYYLTTSMTGIEPLNTLTGRTLMDVVHAKLQQIVKENDINVIRDNLFSSSTNINNISSLCRICQKLPKINYFDYSRNDNPLFNELVKIVFEQGTELDIQALTSTAIYDSSTNKYKISYLPQHICESLLDIYECNKKETIGHYEPKGVILTYADLMQSCTIIHKSSLPDDKKDQILYEYLSMALKGDIDGVSLFNSVAKYDIERAYENATINPLAIFAEKTGLPENWLDMGGYDENPYNIYCNGDYVGRWHGSDSFEVEERNIEDIKQQYDLDIDGQDTDIDNHEQ